MSITKPSVLNPSLGITRIFPYNTLLGPFLAHGFSCQFNADDTQFSFLFQPVDPRVAAQLSKFLEEILAQIKIQPNLSNPIIPYNLGVIRPTFKRHRRDIATTAQSRRFSLNNKTICYTSKGAGVSSGATHLMRSSAGKSARKETAVQSQSHIERLNSVCDLSAPLC